MRANQAKHHEIEVTLSGLFTAISPTRSDVRLPLDAALQLGLQVARVVAQAHDAGRVVGELNASRLRFAANGSVALGAVRGPPLAPELLRGETPDRLSDVYAVGALLYRLLTGRDVGGQRVPEPPSRFNPAVDGDLDELVMSAIDDDPSMRPLSGRLFEQGLLAIFKELDVEPGNDQVQRLVRDASMKARKAPAKSAPRPVVHRRPLEREDFVSEVSQVAARDDDEEDDDFQLQVHPEWMQPGPQRTWMIRAGVALAVVVALLVMWPGKKKPKATRAVDEVAKVAPAPSAPPPTLVLAEPERLPLLQPQSTVKSKKVVYADASKKVSSKKSKR